MEDDWAEGWFEYAKNLDVIFYMHEKGSVNRIEQHLVVDLQRKGINVGMNSATGCLCNYVANDWDLENPKLCLIHTLNENDEGFEDCNEAARKIILANSGTEFWAMDYGSSRGKILGDLSNLIYISDSVYKKGIMDFVDRASSLRR